ncbi:HlyD family secretion protein [Rurimicrobium arvi]|uniref:HlyD family secretion protein n=1 Tax=Rurimicrobium arvi TaxID=2049916 RepID=A0ABP8MTC9_9BACT
MEAQNEVQETKKTNKKFIFILVALVVLGGGYGISKYVHAMHNVDTDDAQLSSDISPVIPRIQGFVTEVRVKDNQIVKKGDTLVLLDDRELRNKVLQAEAALENAKSSLSVTEANALAANASAQSSAANVLSADANIEAAKVNVWRANQDFDRYANLIKDHSITQQQYDEALAAKQRAEKQLNVLKEQKNAAASQANAVRSQSVATGQQTSVASATIKQREADLANAQLNLSYAVILAPADGRVSTVSIQPGQTVQPGQQLFAVVQENSIWVVANFKETQLEKMKEGDKATVKVDAFPGHEFEAQVQSLSPATGARFALLPPDNASGNFVKVVQRIPVKITFSKASDGLLKSLRPGMNALVEVHLD